MSNTSLQVFYGTLPLILVIGGVWFRKRMLLKDLKSGCAELYQVIGAHGGSEKALDNALALSEGKEIPHKDLLPYVPPAENAKG